MEYALELGTAVPDAFEHTALPAKKILSVGQMMLVLKGRTTEHFFSVSDQVCSRIKKAKFLASHDFFCPSTEHFGHVPLGTLDMHCKYK